MPRGSQSLTENIIAQFCKFVETQGKKQSQNLDSRYHR